MDLHNERRMTNILVFDSVKCAIQYENNLEDEEIVETAAINEVNFTLG